MKMKWMLVIAALIAAHAHAKEDVDLQVQITNNGATETHTSVTTIGHTVTMGRTLTKSVNDVTVIFNSKDKLTVQNSLRPVVHGWKVSILPISIFDGVVKAEVEVDGDWAMDDRNDVGMRKYMLPRQTVYLRVGEPIRVAYDNFAIEVALK